MGKMPTPVEVTLAREVGLLRIWKSPIRPGEEHFLEQGKTAGWECLEVKYLRPTFHKRSRKWCCAEETNSIASLLIVKTQKPYKSPSK